MASVPAAGTNNIVEKDFSGGVNLTDGPEKLAPDEFLDILNMFLYGDAENGASLRFPGGNRAVVSTGGHVQGFTRFRTATHSYLLYAVGGHVLAYDLSALTSTPIYTTGHATNRFEFAVLCVLGRDQVFWVDGSSPLMRWDGTGVAQAVGLTGPVAAPTVAVSGTGSELTTEDLSPIQYYITFGVSATGLESNPSPISAPISNATPFAVDLSAIPVSADARVDQRFIYRVGANVAIARRIGVIANNTATTYHDNLNDYLVGDIQLNFSRDTPPVGCSILATFKNRLWMAGPSNPFRLFYCTEAGPDYWPQGQITFPLTDGGYKDIDADRDNPVIGFCHSGSSIAVGRARGLYFVTGDTGDDYAFVQVAGIGLSASRTLVQCGNVAVWQGRDGNVYALGADKPVMLSNPKLRKAMEHIDPALLPGACACYWRERYVLCVPQGNGTVPFCFAYDFPTGSWVNLSDHTRAATQLYGESGVGQDDEILLATDPGYTDVAGNSFTGIVAICTKDNTYLPIRVQSGYRDYGRTASRDRLDGVRLWGNLLPKNGTTPTLTLRAFSGNYTFEKAYDIPFTGGILLDTETTRALCGNHHQWELNATVTAAEIQSLEMDIVTIKNQGRRRRRA